MDNVLSSTLIAEEEATLEDYSSIVSPDYSDVTTADQRTESVRKSNPLSWKANLKKIACQSGKPYKNANGNNVPERQMSDGCDQKCRMKCASKI